jgi:uncharacterized protein DUF6188
MPTPDISQCCLDVNFTLRFRGEAEQLAIRIEAPFAVLGPTEEAYVDVSQPETLMPALALLRVKVLGITANSDGTLVIHFEGDITMIVKPSPPYEAWEANLSDGSGWVCMPSGGLDSWGPRG